MTRQYSSGHRHCNLWETLQPFVGKPSSMWITSTNLYSVPWPGLYGSKSLKPWYPVDGDVFWKQTGPLGKTAASDVLLDSDAF